MKTKHIEYLIGMEGGRSKKVAGFAVDLPILVPNVFPYFCIRAVNESYVIDEFTTGHSCNGESFGFKETSRSFELAKLKAEFLALDIFKRIGREGISCTLKLASAGLAEKFQRDKEDLQNIFCNPNPWICYINERFYMSPEVFHLYEYLVDFGLMTLQTDPDGCRALKPTAVGHALFKLSNSSANPA